MGLSICAAVDKPREIVRDFSKRPGGPSGADLGPDPSDAIGHAAFTPDGTRLAVGTMFDAMICVW